MMTKLATVFDVGGFVVSVISIVIISYVVGYTTAITDDYKTCMADVGVRNSNFRSHKDAVDWCAEMARLDHGSGKLSARWKP
jgi:hypothetical protein